jgi:putative transposase
VSRVASTRGVAHSTVYARLAGSTEPRERSEGRDAELLPASRRSTRSGSPMATAASRWSSTDRRASRGLRRSITSASTASWRCTALLLARRYTERPDYRHDGVVVAIRSNLRWCADGFAFTGWNDEIVRGAFIIDAHDREIIA